YIYGNKQNDDGSFKPSQTFSIIKEAFLKFLVPNNDPNSIPNSRIDGHVQINDANLVIAQRTLSALAFVGALPLSLPVLVPAPVFLSYAEVWDGNSAFDGGTGAAYQVAVGDMNISAAGIQWGNPLFLDMIFSSYLSPFELGVVGAGLSSLFYANMLLLPRAWIVAPVWA